MTKTKNLYRIWFDLYKENQRKAVSTKRATVVDDYVGLIAIHHPEGDDRRKLYSGYEVHCSGYSNTKCELGRNNIKEKDNES